jgi:hypothetical protein
MKPSIRQRRGKMDPITNIFVLLKNLEAFIKSVPIDPNLSNCKDWEKTRAEMKKGLKNTYKILVKQGFPEPLVRCRQVLEKQVLLERLVRCRQVLEKQVFLERLDRCRKILEKQAFLEPLRMCGKVLEKTVLAQSEPVRKKS